MKIKLIVKMKNNIMNIFLVFSQIYYTENSNILIQLFKIHAIKD